MDTSSEAWRFECEVRAVLAMPVERRRGFLELVEKRRGLAAKQQLADAVYRAWIDKQAAALLPMNDSERGQRLARIPNPRVRGDVERRLQQPERVEKS
jgi:hypothetical protein